MDHIATIAVASISLVGTIAVGWFTFAAQRRKDDATARNDLARLQEEIETGLWNRLKSEIDGLQSQLSEERDRRRELETRVMVLEQENEQLRRENARLVAENERRGRL